MPTTTEAPVRTILRLLAATSTALALFASAAAAAQPPETDRPSHPGSLRVTYLANEGFLLEGGGRKVLVDALFEGIPGYPKVPPAMRPELEGARGRFAGVDLVLATHFHGDHFGARAVARHLEASPQARFLSTPQAVDTVRALLRDRPETLARTEASWPEEGTVEEREIGGVRLAVLNLHHGRDRRPPVQNLGFLIELGGLRVLHIGDTESGAVDFRPLGLWKREIDVGLLPVWFLTYDDWIGVTRELLRPRRIVPMHLAEADAPASYFGPDRNRAERLTRIREAFPDAVLLLEAGETATFEGR